MASVSLRPLAAAAWRKLPSAAGCDKYSATRAFSSSRYLAMASWYLARITPASSEKDGTGTCVGSGAKLPCASGPADGTDWGEVVGDRAPGSVGCEASVGEFDRTPGTLA